MRPKGDQQIKSMRQGGRLLALVLATLSAALKPGVTGRDLSQLARRELRATGGQPAFLNYRGYPDVLCLSVNDTVVHGIPDSRPLAEGDVVSLDFGVIYDGLVTDAAITVTVGQATAADQELIAATKKALQAGIGAARTGATTGDIGAAVEKVLLDAGLGIVRDFVGHGVGHYLHEPPDVPNYGPAGHGPRLVRGMTIAIEPMATLGSGQVTVGADGWTVNTVDGRRAAHFEHSVLITDSAAEILTTL